MTRHRVPRRGHSAGRLRPAASPERPGCRLGGDRRAERVHVHESAVQRPGVKRSRYFPSWNVALKPKEAGWLDAWLAAATAAGVEPLISFSQALGSACPPGRASCRPFAVHARLRRSARVGHG